MIEWLSHQEDADAAYKVALLCAQFKRPCRRRTTESAKKFALPHFRLHA